MRTLRTFLACTALLAAGACALRGDPSPSVLPRAGWSAAAPAGPMRPHAPDRITIHHTAVKQRPGLSLEEKLGALQRFSQSESPLADGRTKQPWPDVPYHFYVDAHGRVAEARDTAYAGDSNTAYDPAGHLLIVLEGNFEEERPTKAQLRSLRRLVLHLARERGISASRIGKHNDYADTACPGDHLEAELPALRALVGGG